MSVIQTSLGNVFFSILSSGISAPVKVSMVKDQKTKSALKGFILASILSILISFITAFAIFLVVLLVFNLFHFNVSIYPLLWTIFKWTAFAYILTGFLFGIYAAFINPNV